MNGFRYRITLTTPLKQVAEVAAVCYSGDGDSFGQAIADLITTISKETGTQPEPETLADLIDTGLDAWKEQLCGGFPLKAQRREFSDYDNDFDLTIWEDEQ
jgi:hypothetical protein